MMITRDNEALVRDFIEEVFNNRNLAAMDRFVAPDEVDHTLPPNLPPDRTGTWQATNMFLKAFPDLRITIDEMAAEGDKVIVRYTSRGTQRGPFLAMPPTGRKVEVSSYMTARIANGKIVEFWGLDDQLGMLQQLGVIPGLFGVVFLVGLGAGIGVTVLLSRVFTWIAHMRSTRT